MKTLDYLQKKYNIDFTQKSPIEIGGVGRYDLIRWLRELDFKTGVEIGVDEGRYASQICEQNTQMKLYGVDPWLKYDEYREYIDQAHLDSVYERMKERMKPYIREGLFEPIKKMSMDALADFEDESIDFVYIDGNHEGDFPYQDIKGWAKKVKKGGIVAGHDYVRIKVLDFTIKDALKRYTAEENIHPWFILGHHYRKRGEVRDRTRSWCFVKQ